LAVELGIRRIKICGDSLLVINQASKEWNCSDDKMALYCDEVRKLEGKFQGLELCHVLRGQNTVADELAKLGSSRGTVPTGVFLHELHEPTIKVKKPAAKPDQVQNDEGTIVALVEPDWRQPVLSYLKDNILPDDKVTAERLQRKAGSYCVINDELYRRSASGMFMRCVTPVEGTALLKEIHGGICGSHAASRSLVGKAFRQGFWWPTAVADADNLVRQCEGCQFFARQIHVPAEALQTIPVTWPFATWCLDMVGPFKKAKGGFTHLYVAVDKFTKWIEAKPVATITAGTAVQFIKEITTRFGVPNRIITDNGTQFTAREFKEFCESSGIKIQYASVAHPQSNGQVERANGLIVQGIKARIFDRLKAYAGKWVKELPPVLWALRTTPNRTTQQTPYSLVYGSEVMLPSEIQFNSLRVQAYEEQRSQEGREDDLNRLEEIRDAAVIESAKNQSAMKRYRDRNVRVRRFEVGDLVLRRVMSTKDQHKLSPAWEGPYVVVGVTRPGAYRLQRQDGTDVSNSWSVDNLRRFYC
jgi:transposase InsO family protein